MGKDSSFLIQNPRRKSRFSLSVGAIADILVEVSAEWEPWAGIFVSGGIGVEVQAAIPAAPSPRIPIYPANPGCDDASTVLLC